MLALILFRFVHVQCRDGNSVFTELIITC